MRTHKFAGRSIRPWAAGRCTASCCISGTCGCARGGSRHRCRRWPSPLHRRPDGGTRRRSHPRRSPTRPRWPTRASPSTTRWRARRRSASPRSTVRSWTCMRDSSSPPRNSQRNGSTQGRSARTDASRRIGLIRVRSTPLRDFAVIGFPTSSSHKSRALSICAPHEPDWT